MKGVILCIIAAFAAVILFFNNPEETIWLPKCPFYMLTGLECPSCGSQRAVYHLLHLEFAEAFRYNPFMVISIPYAILLVTVTWLDPDGKLGKIKKICCHKITVMTYVVLFIIWWIVRNLI